MRSLSLQVKVTALMTLLSYFLTGSSQVLAFSVGEIHIDIKIAQEAYNQNELQDREARAISLVDNMNESIRISTQPQPIIEVDPREDDPPIVGGPPVVEDPHVVEDSPIVVVPAGSAEIPNQIGYALDAHRPTPTVPFGAAEMRRIVGYEFDAIQLQGANDTTLGRGVVVAVIDSGVDADNRFFDGSVTTGYDFVDRDDDASTSTSYHGNSVAGIIHAIAPLATILPIRVFGQPEGIAQGFFGKLWRGIKRVVNRVTDYVFDLGRGATNFVGNVAGSVADLLGATIDLALHPISGWRDFGRELYGATAQLFVSTADLLSKVLGRQNLTELVGLDNLIRLISYIPGVTDRILDKVTSFVDTFKRLPEAIRYAVDQGANVINLSLRASISGLFLFLDGTQRELARPFIGLIEDIFRSLFEPVQRAVDYAVHHNVVVVACAGNESGDVDTTWPAALRGVIAVGATDSNNQITDFSNTGRALDIVAPGEDIQVLLSGSSFDLSYGTSFSAPMVSGAVALLMSLHPEYSVAQIEQRLRETSTDLGAPGRDNRYGYGLLNIERLLAEPVTREVIPELALMDPLRYWIDSPWLNIRF